MKGKELQLQNQGELLEKINNFDEFLSSFGLPFDNIIASTKERSIIGKNLPDFLNGLDAETKRDARYLSKFIAGAAVGLFDASLNFLWNEVVINLRKKIVVYGVELFFDAAVGGQKRGLYNTEDDLAGIKDEVLINTCKKIEIISDIVALKLHYIQTMRNEIGASHPTAYSINAYDLMSWLATCVQEVLNEKPSEAAIQIKAFFDNLLKTTSVIDNEILRSMEKPITELSQRHADNLLNSIFNVYASVKTNNIVRKNISLLIKNIWDVCSDNVKYQIGIQLDGYRNNLHEEKYKLGCELFTICDGNRYKTLDARVFELSNLTNSLLNARYGWDNFYNEPLYIQRIMTYFKTEVDIPIEIQDKIIQTILICRIGKGISFCSGVSPSGMEYYNLFLNLLGDDKIIHAIIQLHSNEIRFNVSNSISQKQLYDILKIFLKNVRSEKIKEILQYIGNNIKRFSEVMHDRDYRILTKSHIRCGE
jgi:hypothetical protein